MSRKAMYVRLFFAPPAVLDNCDEHDDATREEEKERRGEREGNAGHEKERRER